MLEVIPGILEQSWEEIERKIVQVSPLVKTIHIDIVDGKFADNVTFLDPKPFKKYTGEFFFELHMMVEEPVEYLDDWAASGFRRFLGHIEKMKSQVDFVAQGQRLGEVGLAIDGVTDVRQLQVPLQDLDALLIMTIKAGFSGQEFMVESLAKVRTIREQSTTLPIEVDGGINPQTLRQALHCGVNRFVSTSFLFASGNMQAAFNQLEQSDV